MLTQDIGKYMKFDFELTFDNMKRCQTATATARCNTELTVNGCKRNLWESLPQTPCNHVMC